MDWGCVEWIHLTKNGDRWRALAIRRFLFSSQEEAWKVDIYIISPKSRIAETVI
jgi:hypothetical protein